VSTVAVAVTTWHLEMLAPTELVAKPAPRPDAAVAKVETPLPELNRFFYTAVGGDWYWIDRLPWTLARWRQYLDRPELETSIVSVAGVPAGYFELESQPEGNVELAYFGLLPAFVGGGLGGFALSEAVRRAWRPGVRRVWVHTCSLDHPQALRNYQRRGFRVFREETEVKELPATSPGPWPGARDGGPPHR
jgi:GNAT superfamily N-acetyltransferase